MVNASNILERAIVNIHKKATDPYDYRRSIAKRSYFDIADVLMHMVRGFMSVAEDEMYNIRDPFKPAALVYNQFFLKELSIDQTIELAFNQGKYMFYNEYQKELPFAQS